MSFTKKIFIRVLTVMFFAVLFLMTFVGKAEVVYRDCFKVVDYGSIRHVSCTVEGLEGINYAVDRFETNDWEVAIHCWDMNDSRIRKAEPGQHYLDDMPQGVSRVSGTDQPFGFEFCNWYRDGAAGSKSWYGFVLLALDENAELVILESVITDKQNYVMVTVPTPEEPTPEESTPEESTPEEPTPEESTITIDWVVNDYGDYLEIREQNRSGNVRGKIEIPSEIGGKPVTTIADGAFNEWDNITSVVLPDTITSIGVQAFVRCESLASCNIPSSVTNIGHGAFESTALKEVILPVGLKEISSSSFALCESLTNVVIGANVTNIQTEAFCRTAIGKIEIPSSIEHIENGAFIGCDNLKTVNVWPWTKVEDWAFESSCEIGYMGTISKVDQLTQDVCGGIVTNFINRLRAEHLNGITELSLSIESDSTIESKYALGKALYLAGVKPAVVSKEGGKLEMKYTTPRLEITSFDLTTRTIKGRLIPQGGCRIVSQPYEGSEWILGLKCYEKLGTTGVSAWWSEPDLKGFADQDTLGEFSHTVSEEDFSTYRFFRLELNL